MSPSLLAFDLTLAVAVGLEVVLFTSGVGSILFPGFSRLSDTFLMLVLMTSVFNFHFSSALKL